MCSWSGEKGIVAPFESIGRHGGLFNLESWYGHWVSKPQNSILWQREFFEWLYQYLKP
jgi:hypothetical protein